ncbi:MAG: GNAT family N-acetyltransferase [Euryarchaeota archaeon]|nr:GNAT family N-acetyltransferase [Euryarchaeota archaeon]
MKVRRATRKDSGEIVNMACEFEMYLLKIDNALIQESPPKATFRKFLSKGLDDGHHAVFVAQDGKRLVGFADLWVIPEFLHGGMSGYMTNLFVRDGVRGKGVGRALLAQVVREAKRRKVVALHVPVKPKNAKAVAFYRKMGIDEQLYMMETRLDR